MAEIMPDSPDRSNDSGSNSLADQWIVGFQDNVSKEEQEAHIATVRELSGENNDDGTGRHYEGVTNVFDALNMYAGEFHPVVVDWIRGQPGIKHVEPNQQTRALGGKRKG